MLRFKHVWAPYYVELGNVLSTGQGFLFVGQQFLPLFARFELRIYLPLSLPWNTKKVIYVNCNPTFNFGVAWKKSLVIDTCHHSDKIHRRHVSNQDNNANISGGEYLYFFPLKKINLNEFTLFLQSSWSHFRRRPLYCRQLPCLFSF